MNIYYYSEINNKNYSILKEDNTMSKIMFLFKGETIATVDFDDAGTLINVNNTIDVLSDYSCTLYYSDIKFVDVAVEYVNVRGRKKHCMLLPGFQFNFVCSLKSLRDALYNSSTYDEAMKNMFDRINLSLYSTVLECGIPSDMKFNDSTNTLVVTSYDSISEVIINRHAALVLKVFNIIFVKDFKNLESFNRKFDGNRFNASFVLS